MKPLLDSIHDILEKCEEEVKEKIRLRTENERLRSMLFPYADATKISGASWGNGFYLIGDDKSIKELGRLQNNAAQVEVFRKAYDEGLALAKEKNERLRFKLNAVRKAIKGEVE